MQKHLPKRKVLFYGLLFGFMEEIPVFAGGALLDFFEDPVKGGDAGKSSLEGYISDGQIRAGQQVLHFFDPAGTEIIIII